MPDESQKTDVAKREEEILAFWQKQKIFEKSLEKEAPKGEFVFYDGPPFATGTPHSGSLLSSVSKDLIPRYKTMRGYRVRRRWGWDCHGLPIEFLVEKKLGLKNKKEIYEVGIEKFNETARAMVLEYVGEWKRYVERVGRFVDFDNSYKTMDPSYMESVWWALKEIHDKGRMYEGRKVLLYCPHCETPLAKAEIAMDNTYKDVTEEAVTIKFPLTHPEKLELSGEVSFLAWTTTPWTLPGNVALAVGPNIDYGAYERGGEIYILAVSRASVYGFDVPIRTFKGKELFSLSYRPLYKIEKVKLHKGKKWEVLGADFVSTQEGTGIVHTAVMYGEDDYILGVKEGLPMVPLLNPNATYNLDGPEFLHGKYIKKAEAEIKDELSSRGLLFEKKAHTHSYPHCYRCGTPLIYNAVSSWFFNMQGVKETLLSENEKIDWFPEHLKHGRFRNILDTAPDWTISRNRFWATPLPIWKDKEGKVTVIGSLTELKAQAKKSGNRYFVMRHGEAEHNVKGIINSDKSESVALTPKGEAAARASAEKLSAQPHIILTSEFLRARQTAEAVKAALGLNVEIESDFRLNEYNHGIFNGKSNKEWDTVYKGKTGEIFSIAPEGGETASALKQRLGNLLYELEEKYSNKNILLVSHGWPSAALIAAAKGADRSETLRILQNEEPSPAEVKEINFTPLPHNKDYELDYHLPYIDEVELVNDKGEPMARIPEVVDCWVESGSMPFAEYHYPFENKKEFEKRSPGNFVSEYIGQTRAWFYYMHAISVQLLGKRAFDNVITTGNILAADGDKLSKSKKNYTDPYDIFHRFGADAFRYYLMSSVVMQAEDVTFRDEDVKEVYGRVVNILRNIHSFYLLYAEDLDGKHTSVESPNILDRWINARLKETAITMTAALERYDVVRGVRPLRDFIDDFSTWYVRRSRERVKGTNKADKQYALHTMRKVLHSISHLMAPVMPFVAEEIFQTVKNESEPESVHLAEWPKQKNDGWFSSLFKKGGAEAALISGMAEARKIVSLALEARQKANIKVRQPLRSLSIKEKISEELAHIIAEEVNVKTVIRSQKEFSLDTHITPELQEEGDVRDVLRFIQDLRKKAGLTAKESAVLIFKGDTSAKDFLLRNWAKIVPAKLSTLEEGEAGNEIIVSGMKFSIDVR